MRHFRVLGLSQVLRNHYSILGIPTGAPKRKIRKAYLEKVKLLHPDSNNSPIAQAAFQAVQEAYSTLIDDKRRSEYDILKGIASEHESTRGTERDRERERKRDPEEVKAARARRELFHPSPDEGERDVGAALHRQFERMNAQLREKEEAKKQKSGTPRWLESFLEEQMLLTPEGEDFVRRRWVWIGIGLLGAFGLLVAGVRAAIKSFLAPPAVVELDLEDLDEEDLKNLEGVLGGEGAVGRRQGNPVSVSGLSEEDLPKPLSSLPPPKSSTGRPSSPLSLLGSRAEERQEAVPIGDRQRDSTESSNLAEVSAFLFKSAPNQGVDTNEKGSQEGDTSGNDVPRPPQREKDKRVGGSVLRATMMTRY
uniref:J domain-containing protein n=1 Tax=Chromera velia CCMP2878 TaxID=1169474 RepID=A0A0G4FVX5_9ALVE|eukprot:Cvel_19025.t1-p1 / transcript=Cvel_19025.t1 / gene=Cvel_19025 / organism=Chromera_velia_CCMP2878 / gene_product=Chaperone protein DnaJ 1, putative / transcript_product=Chaperone protein DnaJ 1, putative / location=Cvel_scaffold1611:28198-30858(+) / protein_length=364 / sequence_SO=supercontig / SO=protein_coding / is_pseudo=false